MALEKQANPLTAPFTKYGDGKLQKETSIYFANMDGVKEFTPIQVKITAYGDSVTNFRTAVDAASTRDKNKIQAKYKAREMLIENTISLGYSVVELADGDPTILGLSGLPQRKVPQPYKTKIPVGLELTAGKQPGTLTAKWKDIKGKRLFFVSYTSNPMDEKSAWTTLNSVKSSSTLGGLDSGSKVWVKIGVIGSDNETVWGNAILSPYIP